MAKMSYAAAMKAYFAKTGSPLTFPKKGSAEHTAIRALMASGDVAAGSGVSAEAAIMTGEIKEKKPKARKAVAKPKAPEDTPVKLEGTTLIDTPHINKTTEAAVDKDPLEKPKAKRKPRAVKADGLPPEQIRLKALTEDNAHIQVAPAQYAGLEEQIKAVIPDKVEGIPKKVRKNPDKTQKGNMTADMKSLEAREPIPFSFTAMRKLLRN